MMQINLTGFLGGSKARLFIGELWNLLASAQSSPDGIPAELVEIKKKELLKAKVDIIVLLVFDIAFSFVLGRK
jgi:hypothetical protein